MNIKFKGIEIENFLSFGSASLSLEDKGYVLVRGFNKNPADNSTSNGSGKSAIWEALSWCLTGSTIRGISSNLTNIHSKDGCKVKLSFRVGKDDYSIIRSKDHKELGSTLKIYINGEDKSGRGLRDTEKVLEQYLPDLTYDLLGSVIILGQGLPQRFTNNTPSGRKEVLEKLSKSDFMIEDIKNKLNNRQIFLNQSMRRVEDSLLENQSSKRVIEENLISYKDQLNSLGEQEKFDFIIKECELNLEEYGVELSKYQKEYQNYSEETEEYKNSLNSLELESSNEKLKIKDLFEPKLNECGVKIASLNQEQFQLKKAIETLEGSYICPTCGQVIPDAHKPDLTKEKNRLEEITKELEILNKENSSLYQEKEAAMQKSYKSIEERKIELFSLLAGVAPKMEDSKALLDKYDHYIDIENKKLIQAQFNKESYTDKKKNLEESINKCNEKIASLESKILYNNNEKVDLQNRLDVVNRMLTLAKRDFRGYLLTNVIQFINSKSKEYCKDIFETESISFELDRNNILISYDGKPYENLSGGEKQKIDIIIQFAIRDMLCQFSNFSSNILVLDEIFDGLDQIGCQKVVDLISKKLIDIESVFIITHHSDIPISADSTLTVIKNEFGVSTIK